ncbi:MAG: adenylate/guanylate cyclase domain-containing protein [Candidatus Acidoferrales bacterium]
MAPSDVKRKLTAILAADVAGYSRLMEADEAGTVETLTSYRKVFVTAIGQYHGCVIDAKGDAVLAEFASVVDAVTAAVEIQRILAGRNAELPDEDRMDFRIGVNLGDVIVQDDTIYGDGVNIAARLESLAEPGGICISGSTYAQVKSKLPLEYEFLGRKNVKNISEPVPAYRVALEAERERPAASGEVGLPLGMPDLAIPDKPSIAVLAFENMSGDPEQEYFSDGISEDIITGLAKISGLFVIARNASFIYKGKTVNPRQIAGELGVKYILEGSVRKAGNRVRITAQLIDGASGNHLWAERYDRTLEDLFAVQDEITEAIVTELDVALVQGEQGRIWRRSLKNPQARDLYYRGTETLKRQTPETNVQARRLFEEVIRLEPESPLGFCGVGMTFYLEIWWGFSQDRACSLEQTETLARQALSLDEGNAEAHRLLGWVLLMKGEHGQALCEAQRAVTLSPSYAGSYHALGLILHYSGRPEEAIGAIRRAMRLCPIVPPFWLHLLSAAYREAGQPETGLEVVRETVRRDADYYIIRVVSVSIYCEQERYEEARAEAGEVYKADPGFSIQRFYRNLPYQDRARVEQIVEALQKAGVK